MKFIILEMRKVATIVGMALLSVFSEGGETIVTYENSDMPLYYHQTRENLTERLEFYRAWYSKINDLIRELNPSSPDMEDVFSVSPAKDGEHLDFRRNYCGDVDLILLVEELESREVFRLCNDATRKETWKYLDVEKGFFRLKNDILRQTRILEKEKFETLPKPSESALDTLMCIYTKEFEGMECRRVSRYDDIGDKIRFDARLKIEGKTVCLAQQGGFDFLDRRWMYRLSSFDVDKIYVRRYFHVYEGALSEFLADLKQMYFAKDYGRFLGAREEVYPETIHLDVVALSEDRKSFIPVRARGKPAQSAHKGENSADKIAFWVILIGTPIPIPGL